MPAPLLGRLSVVCWAVAAALLAWYVSGVARQITYVTLADGRRQERRLPLVFRLLLPLAPNVAPLFDGPASARLRENAGAMLASGGYEALLSAREFLSLKILLPVCLGPLWCLLAHVGLRSSPRLAPLALPVALLGLVLLYSWPMLWLRRSVRRRQTAILRSLPFVLDLRDTLRKGWNTLRIEVTNLPANRIRDLARRGVKWRKFCEINGVDINYKPTTYEGWDLMKSGLGSEVKLIR